LKQWRLEKAKILALPAYVIMHDTTLQEIAERLPRTLGEIREVKGFGPSKAEKFGEEILRVVCDFTDAVESASAEVAPSAAAEAVTVGAKKTLAPISPEQTSDLFLQIELWRQGGAAPDAQALLAALDNQTALDRGGRIVVINAVKDLGITEAADALLRLLVETEDGNLLAGVCAALGRLKVMEATPDLICLLDDNRPGVRRAAVRALGELRAHDAATKLEQLANEDQSDSVKLAARAATRLIGLSAKRAGA
jgi:hypothetical protein